MKNESRNISKTTTVIVTMIFVEGMQRGTKQLSNLMFWVDVEAGDLEIPKFHLLLPLYIYICGLHIKFTYVQMYKYAHVNTHAYIRRTLYFDFIEDI